MLTHNPPLYVSRNRTALIVQVRHCVQGLSRTTCNEQGYARCDWHREQLSGSVGFIKVDRTGLAFKAGSAGSIYLEAKKVDDPTPMTDDHSPRILIADDHTLLAEACKSFLEPEFQVVGIVTTGRELLRVVGELKPDVIVIDVGMPQLNGLDAAEQLRQLQPSCKIVFLTMNMSPDVAAEAFRRGALGYVVKS